MSSTSSPQFDGTVGLEREGTSVAGIICTSPFGDSQPDVVVAACRAGALGVLDLGGSPAERAEALARVTAFWDGPFGVRCAGDTGELPDTVSVVIATHAGAIPTVVGRDLLVEVRDADEGRAAAAAGAAGLIARGSEGGGLVGESTSLILLQRLLRDVGLPVWVRGGVGMHSAAGCIAAGAAGVVLDGQLSLASEASVPERIAQVIRQMDGSETALLAGHRVLAHPGLGIEEWRGRPVADVGAALGTELFPVGQDAALAAGLADRHHTVGGIVRAVAAAMRDHVRDALADRALAPGGPLAEAYGVRHPVAQGPMTRVSDVASFAAAVADGGGMPFLALALLRGPEVRALLTETQALLDGRPFGVGILGFVPAELRSEQLAVVQDVRPDYAIVAGGRPGQARPLEEAGIRTFLHVPSPGLLDRFLKDGARRFVFEGRECGGHVGPRSSLLLWDQQVTRLLEFPDPTELDILFAGGIHDEATAAAVAAVAAPLTAAGAKVGVLMGTAYLFTEEAVATGALRPAYQKEAVSCGHTVLIETSPGHATRCVDSAYVQEFERERRRLEAALPPDEVWSHLEALNLGRLRLASKGLIREGDDIVEVDDATQRLEGMYMIGDSAVMIGELTTIAELHERVTGGAMEHLAAIEPPQLAPVRGAPTDIAIVGIAASFPGAPDVEAYWANLVGGVNSISGIPPDRWRVDTFYDPEGAGEQTPSKWGGFLAPTPFDALRYGIAPASLGSIDPAQLLALGAADRALADAGYGEREFDRERTSVIFGAEGGTDLQNAYAFRASYQQWYGVLDPALDENLPRLTEDSFPGVLTNVISGRIANRLDFGGSNYTVDAACAAGLAALDMACKELAGGTSDMVLCGAVDLHNGITDYLVFSAVRALSPRGQCRTFDAGADGIVLGEGVACVVLKRLADAERDGDRIYAVIRSVAGASDGRSLGLTAPRVAGQRRALDRAYGRAGVAPDEVRLVEAHGTGTVVGDATELRTLTELFTDAGAPILGCTLGSAKTNIGHTKCAAGLAGLIKVARALHAGVLPPTANLDEPNPAWQPDTSPFAFRTEAQPWPDEDRHAGVSAFGFGGTNFHAVVSAYPKAERPAHGLHEWPAELFLLPSEQAADALDRLAAAAQESHGRWRLRDLAFTAARRCEGPPGAAIVAESVEDLRAKLAAFRAGDAVPGVFRATDNPGKLAFLFPGQGSQRPGMLADVFVAFPRLQAHLGEIEDLVPLIYPPAAFDAATRARRRRDVTDTRVAQPALGATSLAMADLLGQLGIRPDMVAGHSYGELTALAVAGSLNGPDMLRLSRARAEAILAAAGDDPGTMAAISADLADVAPLVDGIPDVVVANHNGPGQVVVSGPSDGVQAACERAAAAGFRYQPIDVACAFHSPLVARAADTLAAHLREVDVRAADCDVWSNTTAGRYPDEPDAIRDLLARQVARPVVFADQVAAMYEAGARVFVEVGPGRVLTGLAGRILGDSPHEAVALDVPGEGGIQTLLAGLARLAAAGVAFEVAPLFEGRDVVARSLDDPLEPVRWLVDGLTVRNADGSPIAGALAVREEPLPAPAAGTGVTRNDAVVEYLRNMREVVAAQREVLLGYLGAPRAPADAAPARVDRATAVEQFTPVLAPEPNGDRTSPPADNAAPPAPPPVRQDVMATVVAVMAERTGYPPEMLGPDLDIEADLSIDSIKRVEIVSDLAERLGWSGDRELADDAVESLSQLKSVRAMVEWIEARRGGGPAAASVNGEPQPARGEAHTTFAPGAVATVRLVPALQPAPPPPAGRPPRSVTITIDDGGVAKAVAERLEAHGCRVRLAAEGELPEAADVLVYLGALAGDDHGPLEAFLPIKQALDRGISGLLVLTRRGGGFGIAARNGYDAGAGLAGLVRTVGREYPDVDAKCLDVGTAQVQELADLIAFELLADDSRLDVGYVGGDRMTLAFEEQPLDTGRARRTVVDADSVILATGGARGITSLACRGLAGIAPCAFELVGRSPMPDPDTTFPDAGDAPDLASMRAVLAASGCYVSPADVDRAARQALAGREIRDTVAALEATGAQVRYHQADVTDSAALRRVLDSVYERHGRLSGVLHGAGVLADALIKDKSPAVVETVVRTKLDSARTLLAELRGDIEWLVMFGSVAGVYGNPGQAGYAAANDGLDALAWRAAGEFPGRIVSIDWGPWRGTGMVSPELEARYEREGLGLIGAADGVQCLLDEIRYGEERDAQVIVVAADPGGRHGLRGAATLSHGG